jgi:hypothetical protein
VRDASAQSMREVHGFVDRTLSRSRPDWGDMKLPTALRAQADEVWELVSQLADPGEEPSVAGRLDELRNAYTELYAEAEAIAQSSIAAAKARPPAAAPRLPAPALRIARRVPARYRHSLPRQWRVRIARVLARGS